MYASTVRIRSTFLSDHEQDTLRRAISHQRSLGARALFQELYNSHRVRRDLVRTYYRTALTNGRTELAALLKFYVS